MTVRPDVVAEVYARDAGRCRVGGEPVSGPRGIGWSIQHRLARGMGGKGRKAVDTETPAWLLLVCGSGTTGHHGWIECSERALAEAAGYWIRRPGPRVTLDPEEIPVIPLDVLIDPSDPRWVPCLRSRP